MSEEEELEQFLKVDPKTVQALLQFKTYKELKRLGDRLGAFVSFMGPMTRMFKRELQYQHRIVPAGQSVRVWYMMNPQPDRLVGIITQVGTNEHYGDTSLEWFIDHDPKLIEYQIAPVNNPKEFDRGIPFNEEVEWIAHNDSDIPHVFGVLCDGFFLPKKLLDKIVTGE